MGQVPSLLNTVERGGEMGRRGRGGEIGRRVLGGDGGSTGVRNFFSGWNRLRRSRSF